MTTITLKQKELFDFILTKDLDLASIEQNMSDLLIEEQYNSAAAEAALEIAHGLYNVDGACENDVMDNCHEFVSDLMQHAHDQIIMQWAKNLGMVHKNEKIQEGNLRVSEELKRFKNMSLEDFHAWKERVKHYDS